MAENSEIVAVFKADIEQFKAQMAELGVKLGEVEKKTEGTTVATEKFTTKAKGSASAIKTIGQGLGGLTGLLAVTGRLFGVNTNQLQELIFASQQFSGIAKKLLDTQKLVTSATLQGNAAKEAQVVVNKQVAISEAAASGGMTLLATAAIAAGAAIVSLIMNKRDDVDITNQQTKALEDFNAALANIGSGSGTKLLDQFNLQVLTIGGKILSAQQVLRDAQALGDKDRADAVKKATAALQELEDEKAKIILDRGLEVERTKTEIAKKGSNALINIRIEELKKLQVIDLNAKKRDEINTEEAVVRRQSFESQIAELNSQIEDNNEKLSKENAATKKELDKKALAEREASLQREYKAFVTYWDQVDAEEARRQKKLRKEREEEEFQRTQDLIRAVREREDEMDKLDSDDIKSFNNAADKEAEKQRERAKKEVKDEKELFQQRVDNAQQIAETVFRVQQEAFDKRQELLTKEIDNQEKAVDIQRGLAERGLANTLAFEQKRAAELQRQQQQEAERQKKIKLLETFLNSLAEFSKEDPKTALSKALLQVALATAASAVFAEEGGIIGEIGERSHLTRRHRGGGDVLLHAQTGEGILSRKEMDNLGKRNFHLLKDAARFPVRDDVFAMPKMMALGGVQMGSGDVVKELKALQHMIKNKKESSYSLDEFGNYMKTTMENGVTEITKGKLRKPRFK